MNHDAYADEYTRTILASVKTIAMVGASANPVRAAHHVMRFLQAQGYRVIPVNPGLEGMTLHGEPAYRSLGEVPVPIDMVDVFRNSAAAGGIVDEALALSPLPSVIWMQLGVRDDEAAARAEVKGVKVVMNRCPMIEIGRQRASA